MKKFVILILFLILYGCMSIKTIEISKLSNEPIYNHIINKQVFKYKIINHDTIWYYVSPYDSEKK